MLEQPDRRPVRCHCGAIVFEHTDHEIILRARHHGEMHVVTVRLDDLAGDPEPSFGRAVVSYR